MILSGTQLCFLLSEEKAVSLRDLQYSMQKLCDRNRDGSYGTQADRRQHLNQIAADLHELRFRHLAKAEDLKPKHVHRLVEHWKSRGISPGSMKNRMSNLRWTAEKTNNTNLVANRNSNYDIPDRKFSTNEDKSVVFTNAKINKLPNSWVQNSAILQREFGLRREEALKIIPAQADKGDRLYLQSSWCKGGRERWIPISTDAQREALDQAKALANTCSMIPVDKTYVEHMRTYKNQMKSVGLGQTHGARHSYAQRRYEEITGRQSPAQGGKKSKELTEEEKKIDREARLVISSELGHSRECITVPYLGR